MGRTDQSTEGHEEEVPVTPRELKFKVPSEYQRKLYGLKIVTGKNLSQLVTEAVGAYLHELEETMDLDPAMLLQQIENPA